MSPRARRINWRMAIFGTPTTDEHFLLGVAFDHEPGAAQHRCRARLVGDPPVGVVAGIAMFDEGQARKAWAFEDSRFGEGIILFDLHLSRAAALHRLANEQVADHMVADQ